METVRKFNRRKVKARALRLGHPLFVHVSQSAATSLMVTSALVTLLASQSTGLAINYGPIFLLICAFGAWFVGNRFAVSLGLFIVAILGLNGQLLHFPTPRIDQVLDLALQLGSSLALILMLGVARAALEIEWRFARVDPLTGAWNRSAFFEIVSAKAEQEGTDFLIFADLNGLKELNDQLGHEKGDEALIGFADRVRKAIRKEDVFARLGGDEFVILLRVRDVLAARSVAGRLHQALNLDLPPSAAALTCSLGALVLPNGTQDIDAELRDADALMYEAKETNTGLVTAVSLRQYSRKEISVPPALHLNPPDKPVAIFEECKNPSAPPKGDTNEIVEAA